MEEIEGIDKGDDKGSNKKESQVDYRNEILKNEEMRTEEFLSLENYFNKLIGVLEKEWKTEKKTHNWDYSDYCAKFLQTVGELNKKLRAIQSDIKGNMNSKGEIDENQKLSTVYSKYIKMIDSILALEESNYKIAINIFLKKLKHFELLKEDADEEEFTDNEKEIANLRINLRDIRESINDIITNLKYS